MKVSRASETLTVKLLSSKPNNLIMKHCRHQGGLKYNTFICLFIRFMVILDKGCLQSFLSSVLSEWKMSTLVIVFLTHNGLIHYGSTQKIFLGG